MQKLEVLGSHSVGFMDDFIKGIKSYLSNMVCCTWKGNPGFPVGKNEVPSLVCPVQQTGWKVSSRNCPLGSRAPFMDPPGGSLPARQVRSKFWELSWVPGVYLVKSVLLNKQVRKFGLRVFLSLPCSNNRLKVQFQELSFGSQAPLIGPPGGLLLLGSWKVSSRNCPWGSQAPLYTLQEGSFLPGRTIQSDASISLYSIQ